MTSELFRPPASGSVFADTIFDLQYDPLDIIQSLYEVKTKSSRIVPFKFFETQARYNANLGHRNVAVKPRQVGLSTDNLAIMHAICSTTPNVNALVVTHLDEATASMRETLQNWTEWLNAGVGFGIEIGKDNADELEFKHTNSHIYFGTGGGSGRSKTIQILLASEVAHWKGKDPGVELGGMTESVPDRGLVFVESTPNGSAGPFYGLYNGKGNGYVKHFFPWFIEKSRRLPLNGKVLTLTDEEHQLVSMHGLHHEQIAWRRAKKAQMSADANSPPFEQEYPEDDISCFTAGTRTAFPVPRLTELMKMANVASRVEHHNDDIDRILGPKDSWDPGGKLWVWASPDPTHRYVISCDVGGGHSDGDMSVAMVRDHTLMGAHVATLEGHWSPEKFADLTCKLAELYNTGYLAHERNGLGLGSVNRAVNQHDYQNYHWEDKVGESGKREFTPGFYISSNQRAPLIVAVKQEVIDGGFFSRDVQLIRQMTSTQLVRKNVGGRWMDVIALPASVHDDHLMAYAQGRSLLDQVVFNDELALPVRAI